MIKILIGIFAAYLFWQFFFQNSPPEKFVYEGVPSTQQSPPTVSGNEILGPVTLYQKASVYSAGHGFLLSIDGMPALTSAAHILTPDVTKVDIKMNGQTVVSGATPLDGPNYSTCTEMRTWDDVAFFRASSAPADLSFNLASAPPLPNEEVWLLCPEMIPGKANMIKGVVVESSNWALLTKMESSFRHNGSSGCPMVNANKEVVGIHVCLWGLTSHAVSIDSIRNSFSKVKF